MTTTDHLHIVSFLYDPEDIPYDPNWSPRDSYLPSPSLELMQTGYVRSVSATMGNTNPVEVEVLYQEAKVALALDESYSFSEVIALIGDALDQIVFRDRP